MSKDSRTTNIVYDKELKDAVDLVFDAYDTNKSGKL